MVEVWAATVCWGCDYYSFSRIYLRSRFDELSQRGRRDGQPKSMLAPCPAPSKPNLPLARLVFWWKRIRRKRFKLLGLSVLLLVGLFDYYALRHLVYGQLSVGIWVGFGVLALLSIPVTFFGLIIAAVLLVS